MRVVVTGAAGFIGSNLVHGLNAIGVDDIIAVDDLTDGAKFRNLLGARIADYFDKDEFYPRFVEAHFGKVAAVFHEGACSDTMEHNGRFMLENNYRRSKDLLDACQVQGTRLLYASSAATYGASTTFREVPEFERPLNFAIFDKASCQLQTLGATEPVTEIVSLIRCGLTSFFLGRFVEGFEKFLAEFAIAFCDQAQNFAAQVWSATQDDRPALRFHPLHVFRAFLCRFSIDNLRSLPRPPEEFPRPFRIRIPKHIRRARLHTRPPRLILKTARLIRETGDERNRNSTLLGRLGLRFFVAGFWFFGLCERDRGKHTKTETQRNCGEG